MEYRAIDEEKDVRHVTPGHQRERRHVQLSAHERACVAERTAFPIAANACHAAAVELFGPRQRPTRSLHACGYTQGKFLWQLTRVTNIKTTVGVIRLGAGASNVEGRIFVIIGRPVSDWQSFMTWSRRTAAPSLLVAQVKTSAVNF